MVGAHLISFSLPFLAALQLGNGRGWQPKLHGVTGTPCVTSEAVGRGSHVGSALAFPSENSVKKNATRSLRGQAWGVHHSTVCNSEGLEAI